MNLAVPGSYLAFHEPTLTFVSDARPMRYHYPNPPHGLPFAEVLTQGDGPNRRWREIPTIDTMRALLAYGSPDSLAYTCRLWLKGLELGNVSGFPQMVAWLYGHFLINLLEYSKRGIAQQVLQLFDEKIFRCTECEGRFPRLMPWLVEADARHLHMAAVLGVPRGRADCDQLRRRYMAAVVLGERLRGSTIAFGPVWELPFEKNDPRAMDFIEKKQIAHVSVRKQLGARFSELAEELLRENGCRKTRAA